MKKIDKLLVTLPFLIVLILTIGRAVKLYATIHLWDEIWATGINVQYLFYANLVWLILLIAGIFFWLLRRGFFKTYINVITILFIIFSSLEAFFLPGNEQDLFGNSIGYGSVLILLFLFNYSTIKQAFVRSKNGASS